jgi:hypothetical protein
MPHWAESIVTDAKALLTYLGAGLSTKTVWDLLPFSFVMEWFLNCDALFSKSRLGFNTNATKDCITHIEEICLTHIIEEGCVSTHETCFSLPHSSQIVTKKYVYRWTGENAIDRLQWVVKIPTFMQLALGAAIGTAGVRFHS